MPAQYIASIADIKIIKDLPEDFLPYVSFKAGTEERQIKGDEQVAILNVSTTTSYIVIFLDKGKTIKDVEGEVKASGATLNKDAEYILKEILEAKNE